MSQDFTQAEITSGDGGAGGGRGGDIASHNITNDSHGSMNNPKSYITKVGIDPTSVFASGGRPADSSRNTWTDHSSQSLVDASVTTHDTSTRNISHVFGSELPSSMPNIDHLLRIHSFDDDHPALSVPLPDSPTSSRQSQSSVPSTVMPSRSHSRDRGNVPALKSNHAPFIAPKQASAERPNRSPEASQPESSTIATSTETSVPSRRSRPPPPIHIQSPENSPSEVFSTPGPINPPPTEADSDYLLPQTNNQVPKTSTSIMVPGLTEDPQPEHREANQEDFTATSREPARNGHQGTTSDPHENSPMLIEIHSKLVGTTEGGRGGAERLASSSPGNAFTDASHQSVMDHSVTKHDASITNINYTYGKTISAVGSGPDHTSSVMKTEVTEIHQSTILSETHPDSVSGNASSEGPQTYLIPPAVLVAEMSSVTRPDTMKNVALEETPVSEDEDVPDIRQSERIQALSTPEDVPETEDEVPQVEAVKAEEAADDSRPMMPDAPQSADLTFAERTIICAFIAAYCIYLASFYVGGKVRVHLASPEPDSLTLQISY